MEYTEYLTDKENGLKYKVYNGTAYHIETPDKLVRVLDQLLQTQERIIIDYGDTTTGRSWDEVNDISGRIGRSTGNIKIPLLIHNRRSMGGGAILDHCIIGIKTSKGKRVIYSCK